MADDDEEVRVDAGGDVEEAAPDDVGPQASTINRSQAREELTRLIEVCAQSGLDPEDVAELLEERAEAVEYLYEGMQRYGRQPESTSD